MSNHTSSPEQSGRLYYGETYEESAASMPAGVNVRRMRLGRRLLALYAATDSTLARIDHTLADNEEGARANNPPPEVKPHTAHPEETPYAPTQTRIIGEAALHLVDFSILDEIDEHRMEAA